MNFANVKALTIPEGSVKQIAGGNGVVLWKKNTGPDYTEPFYVENITNVDETLSIAKAGDGANTIDVEYSIDKTNWYTLGSTSKNTPLIYTLTPNSKLYLRANTNTWGEGSSYNKITGISKIGGNIMSLLYGRDFTGQETLFPQNSGNLIFNKTFSNNTILIDASVLVLPVISLDQYCYREMFMGCTSLVGAPTLPATTLNQFCYNGMFKGCISLVNAPVLPATTLSSRCYMEMFRDCTSLVNAPVLPAGTLPRSCYENMFNGCSSLNYIKCLATNISGSNCVNNWVSGVVASGTFVKDANMTSWPTGASGIPSGWAVQNA